MLFTAGQKLATNRGALALIDQLKLPKGRISGRALGALVTAVRHTPARGPLTQLLRADLGIDRARALPAEARAGLPLTSAPHRARAEHSRPSEHLSEPSHLGLPRSAAALHAAYRAGSHDPLSVTQRALAAARKLANQSPTLGPLTGYDDESALAAAKQSAERFRSGAPLGLLDGVPIAIKEEVHQRGFRARLGTSFVPHDPSVADAPVVARLRAAGAIVLGQTAMTELGLSPLGSNPHRRMPRNPHDRSRLAGGSSTGSAVAVATGVTPVSLGCDGGGSIRIPASLCGVFGLKPTFGRIPAVGMGFDVAMGGPGATSVVHIGPLATTTAELATFVEVGSGAHPDDPISGLAPPLRPGELLDARRRGVRGLRIGVDEAEWAAAAPELGRVCRAALAELEKAGATLVPVRIPSASHAAAIGYLTLGIEAFAAMKDLSARHLSAMGADVQLVLSGLETFRPDDYVDGQRLRQGLRRDVAAALRDVDLLAMPSTALPAPQITDAELRGGFLDPPLLDGMCRYAFLANLTGLPAISAPVGSDRDGMPVGLQLIGDAWDEACVLQAAAALERVGVASALPCEAAVDLLG
ncbi:MAG: Glutamyl-tRNA(Gln) amidotransferase subunit A-like protein [Polyangiaceae bacterium]|nr:Glutamyl-tRNA(Gln) amidotransferase subunit A-like protein [Polyangiaceae bacterium]